MTTLHATEAPAGNGAHRYLPLLLLLFIGSGCSALIYEIVWLQMLQLVVGSTAVSLGVLLGIFMGGMCLGSLGLPRLVSDRRHPLRVYALLEIGIATFGLLILFAMPSLEVFYTAFGHGSRGILLRGLIGGLCLLPPTLLMGATLPAIARWVEATPQGVAWLGYFYGGNIAGAVFGCLLAGFYLLRVYDMGVATYVAAALNAVVAVSALLLASRTVYEAPVRKRTAACSIGARGVWSVYLVIGLSGFCALGAEVVWTRLLSLILGGTVYTFSIILAVFLTGLGIGSCAGSVLARDARTPRHALGVAQFLLAGAIAWSALMISHSIPHWPVNPTLSLSPWYTMQLDVVRCLWAVLPAACLWGASFPLALASVASRDQDPGGLVGNVYAANTVGAIAGSLAFGIVVIPQIGTQNAQRVLIASSSLAALLALCPKQPALALRARRLVGFAGAAAVAGWLIISVSPVPWGVVAFGRFMATYGDMLAPRVTSEVPSTSGTASEYCLYLGEGMNVSVAVTESQEGLRRFHGGGKVQASNDPVDMRLQRMLGHLPALVHDDPKTVLVVACGAGVTAGSFIVHPGVHRIVICDIEPLVPQFVAPMFAKENYDVVGPENADRVEVVYDDGRHFLRTTDETFDIITSDPIDPWVKGCAALNTVEYYQMCKEHLNPGGVMALWMPLYESNSETLKSVVATFFEVFPNGILWTNDRNGEGYDAVLFGQIEPTVLDVDALQKRLDGPDHALVRQSLSEVGFESVHELLATYAGQASQMREWSRGVQINSDRNLRLQYLAGFSLNSFMGKELLDGILRYYLFPEKIFTGSDESLEFLQDELAAAGRH